eukprot:2473693-Prymnesium_polylepis.1
MLCTCSPRGSPVSQEAQSEVRHSAEKLACSTQLFSRSHPRKHPAEPPEHLERSVGLRPSPRGRPTRSRACFLIPDVAFCSAQDL